VYVNWTLSHLNMEPCLSEFIRFPLVNVINESTTPRTVSILGYPDVSKDRRSSIKISYGEAQNILGIQYRPTGRLLETW
jgi:hypothetical protein